MSDPIIIRRLNPAADDARNAPESVQTRQAILDAAQEFILSGPFRDMTVRSLMANVEVSRPAFYQYFEHVHELMETLHTDLQDESIRNRIHI